jgi:Flp pilus assembly protein TadG
MTGGVLRRLPGDRRAVLAVEFAIALPVMLLLYIMAFVLSDMTSCNRKVTITARAMADMATRYAALSTSTSASNSVATIIAASEQVLTPYSTDKAMVRLSEVCALSTSATTVQVIWSQVQNGTALTVGNTFTVSSGLFTAGSCQILAEVQYTYTPAIGLGSVVSIPLYDSIYMTPRLSTSIPLS